ncbi:hypothetical protein D3C84_960960 [compost metagenome]
MLDTGHRRAHHLAAGSQYQAVVGQLGEHACGIAIADTLAFDVDALGIALDEGHPHGVEQVTQRRHHLVHLGFVEARTNAQFGLGGEHDHFDVITPVLVQQASCAQGAPHTTEAGADNQDALFHCSLHKAKSGVVPGECTRAS